MSRPSSPVQRHSLSRDLEDVASREQTQPISTSKQIALVATVSGAGFLNVSLNRVGLAVMVWALVLTIERTFASQASVIILPKISKEYGIPASRQQWVISAYLTAFGCFLLLLGRIADIHGNRWIFILGSLGVTLTTALAPLMPNEAGFIAFRALQGIGAAANVPTAIGIIGTTFTSGRARTFAFGFYSAGTPLGSVVGNLTAGFVSSFVTWKWVFGIMSIFAALITIAGMIVIPNPNADQSQSEKNRWTQIDWLGAVIITSGVLCLLFALTEGNVVGWSAPWVGSLIGVSAVLISAFVWWERRLEIGLQHAPIVKISLFRKPKLGAATATIGLLLASFNGYLVYATLFYQDYQGRSPLQTTLRFIPTGVTGVIMAIAVSPLLLRIPTFWVLASASLAVSLSSLIFAIRIGSGAGYFTYGLWAMILATYGADTAIPCLYLIMSHSLSAGEQAVGGALLNVAMQIGRVLGLAMATATQTAVMAKAGNVSVEDAGQIELWERTSLFGLQAAFWLNFGLGVSSLGIVIGFLRSSKVIGRAS